MHDSVDVVLYTRRDCPLCEDAKAAIRAAETHYRLRIRVREVDIDHDPALLEKFTNDVPVIYINGREAFRHRVTPRQIADLLEGGDDQAAAAPPPGSLAAEKCVPCRGGIPALKGSELEALSRQLADGWRVVDEHHLEREFTFPDFAKALDFTNRVGAVAEEEGHHPDLCLAWGKVGVKIWTHKVDGLTRSDFVLAAKIDRLNG
jgi:4a-hydroxytetrahydrobiopterin dehydratase